METFIANFSLKNYIAELITTIEGEMKTWPEMVSELRHHLARRRTNAVTTAKRKANQMGRAETDTFMSQIATDHSISHVNNPLVPQPMCITTNATPTAKAQHILAFLENSSCEQVDAFIGEVASDWNVGNRLWPHLPQQLHDQIVSIRNTTRSGVSGGSTSKHSKW